MTYFLSHLLNQMIRSLKVATVPDFFLYLQRRSPRALIQIIFTGYLLWIRRSCGHPHLAYVPFFFSSLECRLNISVSNKADPEHCSQNNYCSLNVHCHLCTGSRIPYNTPNWTQIAQFRLNNWEPVCHHLINTMMFMQTPSLPLNSEQREFRECWLFQVRIRW